MKGQIVELLQDYKKLPKGTEGIVRGVGKNGWIVVFGSVSLTLPFSDAGTYYILL